MNLRLPLALMLFLFLLPGLAFARTWKEIKATGTLIIITMDRGSDISNGVSDSKGITRIISPLDDERIMLEQFARENKLKTRIVEVDSFQKIFDSLDRGIGDVAFYTIVDTPERRKKYLLSQPYSETRQVAFTWTKSPVKGQTLKDLTPYTGTIELGTSYEYAVKNAPFKLKYKGLNMPVATNDDIIRYVAEGNADYSVIDECYLDAWMAYNKGVRKICAFPNLYKLVFASDRKSADFMEHLNEYLKRAYNTSPKKQPFGDFDVIKRRGYIRVLTKNDAYSCYMNKGAMCGFEFELVERFAKLHDLSVAIIIPPKFADITMYLEAGYGDVIAANFTMTPQRVEKYPDLTFCSPYLGTTEYLCGRLDEAIKSPKDVQKRSIFIRNGTSYADSLEDLHKSGATFRIYQIADKSTPQILKMVQDKKCDLTIADDLYIQLAIDRGCQLQPLFPVSQKRPFAWVVRASNPKLAAAVNEFFAKENRSTFFNVLKKKYYSKTNAKKTAGWEINGKQQSISPYDDLFKKYGEMYGFDWYFLAAQAYQESRFDPKAVSRYNARGLMQVLPKTAAEMGIGALEIPENGIHAGAKYMAKLYKRFGPEVNHVNKLFFSLAAYNAGYGHLLDARKLAKKMGLDPNLWPNNVEKALDMLSEEKYAAQAQFGYCRSSETINYVSSIMAHALAYEKIFKQKK